MLYFIYLRIAEVVRVASKYFAPPPQVNLYSPQTDCTFKIQNNHNILIKRDQLDAICFIISLFNAQHVSDVNTSILRSL